MQEMATADHLHRGHRGRLRLRRARARSACSPATRSSRCDTAQARSERLRRARRPTSSRAATSPSCACRTARAASSATRSRAPARRSSTSAPTSALDAGWAYGLTELFRAGRARLAPGRQPRLLRDRGDPRARAARRGRACSTRRSRSTASRASPAPGASRRERTHVSEVEGGVQPYSPTGHRHIAEIERSLERLAGEPCPVTFTPHLAAALARPRGDVLRAAAPAALAGRRRGALPRALRRASRSSRSSERVHPRPAARRQRCHVGVWIDERTQTAICAAAIDNLVKGAAGQALQNANLDARARRGRRADGARAGRVSATSVGVCFPRGFRAAGVTCGIKASGAPDLALVACDGPADARPARSRAAAWPPRPSLLSREHLADGRARAVVVNSRQRQRLHRRAGHATTRARWRRATARALGIAPRRGRRLLDRRDRQAAADGRASSAGIARGRRRALRRRAARPPPTRSARPTRGPRRARATVALERRRGAHRRDGQGRRDDPARRRDHDRDRHDRRGRRARRARRAAARRRRRLAQPRLGRRLASRRTTRSSCSRAARAA